MKKIVSLVLIIVLIIIAIQNSDLKKENESVLVQNEIPENVKYRKAFKITEKGVEEIWNK